MHKRIEQRSLWRFPQCRPSSRAGQIFAFPPLAPDVVQRLEQLFDERLLQSEITLLSDCELLQEFAQKLRSGPVI